MDKRQRDEITAEIRREYVTISRDMWHVLTPARRDEVREQLGAEFDAWLEAVKDGGR